MSCDRCEALKQVLKEIKEKVHSKYQISRSKYRWRAPQPSHIRLQPLWGCYLRLLIYIFIHISFTFSFSFESSFTTKCPSRRGQTRYSRGSWWWILPCYCRLGHEVPSTERTCMCEFFGKRGRTWHVSAVITRSGGCLEVECFVHIFNSYTQNKYAVASIFEHLFRTIKLEYPTVTKAFLRSDNAGCYHNGPLLLCLPDIGKCTGLTIVRYDFSDPQAGKDICDHKTAPMKAHIRHFVNEKNNVETAQ